MDKLPAFYGVINNLICQCLFTWELRGRSQSMPQTKRGKMEVGFLWVVKVKIAFIFSHSLVTKTQF